MGIQQTEDCRPTQNKNPWPVKGLPLPKLSNEELREELDPE